MSARKPLIVNGGQVEQLPAVDAVEAKGVSAPAGEDLALVPGAGKNVRLSGLAYPSVDSGPGYVLSTNGGGSIVWQLPVVPSNLLINGGFDYFQRQAAGTATARNDDTYGPDRWVVLSQTASVQSIQTTGPTEARYGGRLIQNQAAAQRLGMAQIVEAVNCFPMRGLDARFQARVKCSANTTIRAALLAWTASVDSVTSDAVNNWTSTNYTANNFFANGFSVVGLGSTLVVSNVWSYVGAFGTVPSNCNNLVAVVWSESTLAQNDTLDVSAAAIYPGTIFQNWYPRAAADELALCLRYYQKSYPVGVAPGSASAWSGFSQMVPLSTWLVNTGALCDYEIYRQTLRANVNAVPYSPNTGTSGRVFYSGVGDKIAEFNYASDRTVGPCNNRDAASIPANAMIQYHYTVDAEL